MAQQITTDTTGTTADRELKAKHRTMWGLGAYDRVADEIIPSLGPVLVEAAGITAQQRVLDVAAGTGNAAVPAARVGADVVASDLTPALLEIGERSVAGTGLHLDWQEADAEALPFDDGAFDAVISCVGVMFAPHHQDAADELLRVTRPGGTIGLLSWTPEGFIGQMFATMKPFAPPAPPGAQPPPLWGREDHVRALFADGAEIRGAQRRTLVVDAFTGGAAFRDYFKQTYGPTIAIYRAIAADPEKVVALDTALAGLGEQYGREVGGSFVMEWEYLLLTATRR
ncbi:class I SAM-dependent methyltransferase [Occultella glacieicola]|uniref:Class I SAM-dependent methyltransferase n=1 Tax=Occultella glacieicola TaxID=2518684 RepID=A0ABY2E6L7_9MICO|nr:class I SAM-dependent methyltransferase [Occultella glacieicola]TDE97192.1 class I SAM-dependent methyltransferase [Occultella glacieicola]